MRSFIAEINPGRGDPPMAPSIYQGQWVPILRTSSQSTAPSASLWLSAYLKFNYVGRDLAVTRGTIGQPLSALIVDEVGPGWLIGATQDTFFQPWLDSIKPPFHVYFLHLPHATLIIRYLSPIDQWTAVQVMHIKDIPFSPNKRRRLIPGGRIKQ